jgi:hypothetical protein
MGTCTSLDLFWPFLQGNVALKLLTGIRHVNFFTLPTLLILAFLRSQMPTFERSEFDHAMSSEHTRQLRKAMHTEFDANQTNFQSPHLCSKKTTIFLLHLIPCIQDCRGLQGQCPRIIC